MNMWKYLLILAPFTLMACGGGGGNGGSSTTSTFEPRYAYVLNEDDPSVSWYLINEQTGDPRHLGYLYLGEEADSVHDMVLHTDGNVMYVSDPDGEAIHALTINPATGHLSYEGSVEQSRPVWDMAIAPDGAFIIVAQGPGDPAHENPERYAVLQIDDQPVPMPATTLTDEFSFDFAPPGEGRKSLGPDGDMLFFEYGDYIASLPVGPDGTFDTGNIVSTSQDPRITAVAVDPDGEHLYAVARDGHTPGNVLVYAINNDGSLTLAGSASASGNQEFVSVSPHGGEFYALNEDGIVTVGTFDADTPEVSVAELGDAADPARTNVLRVAAEPAGKFLYTTTSGADDGESLGVSPIEDIAAEDYTPRFGSIARETPSRIIFAAGDPVVVTAHRLFVGDASEDSDAIDHFEITADDALVNRQTYLTDADDIRQLALIPGRNALLSAHQEPRPFTSGGGQAQVVQLDPVNGEPMENDVATSGILRENTTALIPEPSGRFIYAAVEPESEADTTRRQIIEYDPVEHELSFGPSFGSGQIVFRAFSTDPAGRFVFKNDVGDFPRIRYRPISADDGALGSSTTITTSAGDTLTAIESTPDGAFLIAISDDDTDSVVVSYSISPLDGTLTEVDESDLGAPGVAVAVHPSSEWVYVISRDGSNNLLQVYSLDSEGALSTNPVFADTSQSAANAYASIALHPLGTALYIGRASTSPEGDIVRFTIDADDGGLLQGPEFQASTVQHPRSLAIFSTRQ